MGKVLAAYGGGFKPPTAGHFEIVKNALQEFPEIDEFYIYVGGKVRDGIDQFEAIQIWDIYKKYLANKVNIQPSKSPIGDILRLAKDNPQDIIYFVIGYREGRQDDLDDVSARTSNLDKYPNIIVKVIPTYDPDMSGTNARKALDKEEDFIKFIPDEVKEKSEIYKLVQRLDEIALLEAWLDENDPKKGTGKKPKGSSRRLYTDEDPKDTVGVKFSTRQDIVDTLGKASFKAKSHARQSQIINLIHQRVRAALSRTKDPAKKKKLKAGFEYIKDKKEASKKKTQRLKKQKQKNENVAPNHDGKAAPFGSGYDKVKERKGFGGRSRYRAIEKRGDKYYFIQDNPFSPGIRQEFGPYKTKEQAKKKMNSFPPSNNYRDIGEGDTYEKMAAKGKKAGKLKQGTVRKRLNIPKGKKIPLSKINKELARLRKMDKDKDKKGVQLGDKNQKYYKALQLSKTLKTTTNVNEIAIDLTNYDGQILPGDVLRAPKGFPLGGKKLEKSLQLKVIKNSREGVNRYKLSLEDENGKKYSVRNYEMDGEYKGKKLPKWGLVRKSKKNINENATYSKKIDLIDILSRFTQHMLDKGMNIQPLPMLQMIDGDVDNASQFLGKTAYYDPNTQTIALYTEGRHPKDIARSYAHEMIHHIQYLENRLDNVQTTNTLEDERLNKLEQEANLRGTMTFRNWTDSLNEVYKHKFGFNDKLGKDPFGLNQFAREIATEVENAMNKKEYKIFSDMDGVITDFNGRFEKYSDGISPSEYEKRFGKEKFWELADGEGVAFWVGMPWMSDGKRYWDYIKNYDVELLSSPSRSQTSRLGKRLWVRNNLPGIKLTLAQAAKKQNYAAPNHILIDDRESNIEQWRSQGGIGILHTSAADTIEQLKQLGL